MKPDNGDTYEFPELDSVGVPASEGEPWGDLAERLRRENTTPAPICHGTWSHERVDMVPQDTDGPGRDHRCPRCGVAVQIGAAIHSGPGADPDDGERPRREPEGHDDGGEQGDDRRAEADGNT